MDFLDPQSLLDQITSPLLGLQIMAIGTLINVMFGVLVAYRDNSLDRSKLLNFLRHRIVEQLAPIAVCGFLAIYMPMFLPLYIAGASFMIVDLAGDVKQKSSQLWSKKV